MKEVKIWPQLLTAQKSLVSVRWELAKRNDFCSGGKELEKEVGFVCANFESKSSLGLKNYLRFLPVRVFRSS